MLAAVLGSRSRERVLAFLFARKEGYARQIAAHYRTDLTPIQKQLDRLELGGVLASRTVGRTRLYTFNPRYPFLKELHGLLERGLSFYPQEQRESLVMVRRRPKTRTSRRLPGGPEPRG